MLPAELFQTITLAESHTQLLEDLQGTRFEELLSAKSSRFFFESRKDEKDWVSSLRKHVADYLDQDEEAVREARQFDLLLAGLAALYAFLQANVTGPPLQWDPALVLKTDLISETKRSISNFLSSDGEAAYHLAPHVELFVVAKVFLNADRLPKEDVVFAWGRMSVNYWHQQLLNQISPSLQSLIEQDISFLDSAILSTFSNSSTNIKTSYLLEKASIHILHGSDKKARQDLKQATELHRFEYVLTGKLGKRTKFQQFDTSQLVVLAKSQETASNGIQAQATNGVTTRPDTLELNDDTLLDSISFKQDETESPAQDIPPSLAALDAANQPVLDALDSIILLSVASSITNTSPQHGLTREETLPYATRVLEGGSTNWQLYTQALLVRSRIEGYKARTVERSVLQLQALVDQVIAETSGTATDGETDTSTFLPRPKPSESASPIERLQYIDQLGSPLRWSLEAELASRWVELGGLRTALEIFERLEMWADAALCWAATDREDKARKLVRRQLYHPSGNETKDEDAEEFLGSELELLPADAPRLFCILGDIEKETKYYERAWEISDKRFARAQRSLGKHYVSTNELDKADEAYSRSLAINPQNAATWFALGCVRLETRDWLGAVDAFSRMIQLEQEDAEAWSNLAAALLRLPSEGDTLDSDGEVIKKGDPQKHTKEAFVALKRATSLKRESHRIWQNLLNVAATITPPPYTDLIVAQQRLIELRGNTEGEGCVDIEVMEGILSHIIASKADDPSQPRSRYGMENMFTQLVWNKIVPLVTHSRRLWKLIARLAIFENKPTTALDAYEKAWRTTLNTPGWDEGTGSASSATTGQAVSPETAWEEVVASTLELVDAYESLGEKEVTEGLAAGTGELVCRNWKYKARMAVRSVIGRRAKAGFEDVDVLKERAEDLKV